MSEAIVIGDEQFIAKLAGKHVEPEGLQEISVTIDPQGNLIGDTSHIPENILAQLQSPEAQAQMRTQYRDSRYEKDPPRKPKYLNTGGTRDLTKLRAAGQTRKEFRAIKSKMFKNLTKQALRMKKGN